MLTNTDYADLLVQTSEHIKAKLSGVSEQGNVVISIVVGVTSKGQIVGTIDFSNADQPDHLKLLQAACRHHVSGGLFEET